MGLFFRMIKSYFDTSRYEIIDYGFCFLKGFIQLRKKGVFACAFVKKRIYWPSVVPGKYMEDNSGGVDVGETDAIQGKVDDVIYNLWGMKEPNNVMIMMAIGCRLLVDETCKDTVRRWKENG